MVSGDIQGKNFPGFGRCIYCGSLGGTDGLRNEHIIPFSLGGNTELENASCMSCEKITSYLDGYLARHVFGEYRSHAGMQSRNPKRRPKTLLAEFVSGDQKEIREFEPSDHPHFVGMPVWGLPGILLGVPPSRLFDTRLAHIYWQVPEPLQEELRKSEDAGLRITKRITLNHITFARSLVKIAYCHAVVVYGLNGFRHLALPDIVLGKYPLVPYFVGCETTDPPPPSPEKQMHLVNFSYITLGRLKLMVISVRLFAHSGTEDHGFPIYRIVCGLPKST